jgi:hypothetical protein
MTLQHAVDIDGYERGRPGWMPAVGA